MNTYDPRGRDRAVLATLLEITQHLGDGSDLERIMAVIAKAACSLSGADSASVLLLDEEREKLLCRASHGLSASEIDIARFSVGEGLAGWVVAEGRSLRLDDALSDARFKPLPGQSRLIRGFCCVPLSGREGVIGVMSVTSSRYGAFDESDESILSFLAASVVKDVDNARLYRLAVTDPLTGVYNRQYLSERFPSEIERHRRYGHSLSVALVDVDHFKSVNDRFGHPVGDTVLRMLAERCMEAVREVDIVIRYGGEEFMLVLPQTHLQGAFEVTDRLRRKVEADPMVAGEVAVNLTVSAGVTEVGSTDLEPRDIIARVDAALYSAKQGGRNRVEAAVLPGIEGQAKGSLRK